MKNLTRVLALVLVFSLMLGSVAFAGTFTDVKEDGANAEAISVLADLGILKGYEDGSFGPEKVITRAEVVAVINRLQGLEQAAKGNAGATIYTDVKADHWASGDINLATQMGVVAGDGNGLFRPEDQVKYEEAVKMVVAALGYTPAVADKGGWPTGYLVIASDKGITKGLNNGAGDPATREIVARLVFQALDAPLMEQVGYGKDASYQAMDGTGGLAKKTALANYLHIHKLAGQVIANNTTSIKTGYSAISSDDVKVKFDITDHYNVDVTAQEFAIGDTRDFLVGATKAAGQLGYTSIAYVKENDDLDWEILSINNEKGKNIVTVIEDTQYIQYVGAPEYPSAIGAAANPADMYLSVFNVDEDTDNKEYAINATTSVVYNGMVLGKAGTDAVIGDAVGLQGASASLGKFYAPKQGTVTLLDNNKDDIYEYIFVTAYDTAIVDEVYNNNTKIATKLNGIIDLDFADKKDCSYTLTMDGEAIEIADLQEWDVLSIAKTTNGKHFDIIVARDTVEGAIEQVDIAEVGNTDVAKYILDIEGNSYRVAVMKDIANANISSSIAAGDEGIFYLDAFGRIAFYDKKGSASKNFGFLVSAGKDASSMDDDYKVRVMDNAGEIKDYYLADKVRVTATYVNAGKLDVASESVKAADLYAGASNVDTTIAAADGTIDALANLKTLVASGVIASAQDAAKAADYARRIVTFSASTEGKINAITFAANTAILDGGYFTHTGADAIGKYNAKTATIGANIGVTEDTKIFFLPINANATKEDFEVRTIDSLVDEQEYKNIHYFNVDKDGNAALLLITDVSVAVGENSSLAVLTAIANTKVEGEDVYKLTFLQDGEEKTMTTTADLYTAADASKLLKGAIFGYAENNGEITDMELLGFDAVNYTEFAGIGTLDNVFENVYKAEYVFGIVYKKDANRNIQIGTLNGGGADLVRHKISEDANIYLVDLNKSLTSSSRVAVASYGDIQATYVDPTGAIDKDQDFSVFLKYYNEEITDVIIYKGYINKMQP